MPLHVVHRLLKWAPPLAAPMAMTRVPSEATDCHRASKAYPLCGVRRTSLAVPAELSMSIRGAGGVPAARPPTSSQSPMAVKVTGSTPVGSGTTDQDNTGPALPVPLDVDVPDPPPAVQPAAPSSATAHPKASPRARAAQR